MTMTTHQRLRLEGYLYLAAFGLCIPAANWMIGHVGTTCVPPGRPLARRRRTTGQVF